LRRQDIADIFLKTQKDTGLLELNKTSKGDDMSARTFNVLKAGSYGIVQVHHFCNADRLDKVTVWLHNTRVLVWNVQTKEVVLNCGGWRTATTKTAINTALKQINKIARTSFGVYQEDFEWYVSGVIDASQVDPVKKTIDFQNNMVIRYE
jgi:hypothetical protein